jgi:hypothetical protein
VKFIADRFQTRHDPTLRAKRTGTHHPLGAILQKFERRGDVFAKAIEAPGCRRRTALPALPSLGDYAERGEEARSTYCSLYSHPQRACGGLCRSASSRINSSSAARSAC